MANIWIACADNNIATVTELLAQGVSPNVKDPNGYTPIHAAASYNHVELLRLLMSHGGDVNIQDSEGDTPLHHVEDAGMAKLLVETYGADYKIKNEDGLTAMEYIEEDGEFPEVVKYLRSLIHGGVVDDEEQVPQLPEGQQLRYEYRNVDEDLTIDIDDDKRQQLKEIVESDNPEERLKQFLKKEVHDQFYTETQGSPAGKKRKE